MRGGKRIGDSAAAPAAATDQCEADGTILSRMDPGNGYACQS